MRIIFAGTPEFAAKALEALIQSEHEVVMVLSQPDRPAGRGRKLKESAVKALAKQHHIPVYTPLTLRVEKGGEETAEVLAKMQEANADVLVVAAYGLIVPQFVLDIPSVKPGTSFTGFGDRRIKPNFPTRSVGILAFSSLAFASSTDTFLVLTRSVIGGCFC